MDFAFTPEQLEVAEVARRYAQEVLAPKARQRDIEHTFPLEECRQLAELGLMGVNVPAALGGSEAGVVAYSLALQEVAAACGSTSVGMAVTNMCSELVAGYARPEVAQKYVPRLMSGEAIAGAFGLSEPQAGSDAAGMRTTAVRKGDRYVINGSKQWISQGKYAGVLVVWARTSKEPGNKGISCFVVEGGSKGLIIDRAEEKLGLRGSNTAALSFEDLEVPVEHRMGEEGDGFKLAMTALNGGRIGIASQALGIARGALEASLRYARDRQAFGKSISQFQAIQWFLADMKVQLEAGRLLTYRAARLKEQGKSYVREASMAKLFATEAAVRICDKAVQIHGGYGYINEFPVERMLRDARATPIYEGTSEIQRLVIARELLRD